MFTEYLYLLTWLKWSGMMFLYFIPTIYFYSYIFDIKNALFYCVFIL